MLMLLRAPYQRLLLTTVRSSLPSLEVPEVGGACRKMRRTVAHISSI